MSNNTQVELFQPKPQPIQKPTFLRRDPVQEAETQNAIKLSNVQNENLIALIKQRLPKALSIENAKAEAELTVAKQNASKRVLDSTDEALNSISVKGINASDKMRELVDFTQNQIIDSAKASIYEINNRTCKEDQSDYAEFKEV